MPITRYDRSPLEQCISERDRFQEELGCWKSSFPGLDYGFAALKMAGLQIDIKRYKEALEKAMVALGEISKLKSGAGECARAWCIATNSLSTINDLLDKEV